MAIETCSFKHPTDIDFSRAIVTSLEKNRKTKEKGKGKKQGKMSPLISPPDWLAEEKKYSV